MLYDLVIDKELSAYMPGVPQTTDAELERQLLDSDGPIEPLVIWKGRKIVVDGHRRYALCQKHKLSYQTRELAFEDRAAAKHWMDKHQIGRRNLNPHQQTLVLARLLEYENQQNNDGRSCSEAAGRVAETAGVTTRTVYRSQVYAGNLKQIPEDIRERIVSGELKASFADVAAMAELNPVHQRALVANYDRGEYKSLGALLHTEDEDDPLETWDDPAEPEDSEQEDNETVTDTMSGDTESHDATRRVQPSRNETKPPPAKPRADLVKEAQQAHGRLRGSLGALNEAVPDEGRLAACKKHLEGLGAILRGWVKES